MVKARQLYCKHAIVCNEDSCLQKSPSIPTSHGYEFFIILYKCVITMFKISYNDNVDGARLGIYDLIQRSYAVTSTGSCLHQHEEFSRLILHWARQQCTKCKMKAIRIGERNKVMRSGISLEHAALVA